MNIALFSVVNINGEIRQHIHESNSAEKAVDFVPNLNDIYPPATQAIPPDDIIMNDNRGILNEVSGCIF